MTSTKLKADWLALPAVQTIFSILGGAEGKTRAVGGIVRDSLLGSLRPNTDIDMATELLPVSVMQRAKAAGIATYPTGIDHGTVTLRLDDTSVEVTTLRKDVETDGRHAQVEFGTDWVEDAQRRDFTMNALYVEADGTVFDPLGGLGDLHNQRVRFIGDAATRIAEDGLRVYRFFRFSTTHGGGQFDAEGLAACRAASGRLDHLSRERVGSEMMRMLAQPKVARTLAVMQGIGLVRATEKQIASLVTYEDLGGRSAEARLALLGADSLPLRQAEWRLSGEVYAKALRIVESADLLAHNQANWAAYRFGEDAVEGLAVAASTDDWPRDRLMEAARELARLPAQPLPVSGKDLIEQGVAAGPELGQRLKKLEKAWVESGFTLSKDELLAL
ncbi:CCA tRNA nucleotidyltransferase [Devosia sp. MC521]|uniref:CCA tRNA nucleotidyltransferase n=1 Tax=Devosia sp. MC521 TaxID=2759954 RepID=UPI0015F941B4|nr:CCA tRNA nucleotidyltransferase [Devosia sp. MC521]MBJ6987505.1 CCA tRNA nucleotidyltransferase [Devosia sp. MC521]QMW61865.1 CCA tRNA nucleotidyltransferase [Devosia sp. MC521]